MMERPFPLVSVVKAVAVTAMLVVLALLLLPIAFILVPFLPLPVAYVTARHGWLGGIVVAAVSAVLVYFAAGSGVALVTLLLTVAAGVALGWALRAGWRFSRSLAVMSGAVFGAFVVYGIVLWLGFGIEFAKLKVEWSGLVTDMGAMYTRAGMNPATVEAATSYMRDLADVLPYMLPGVMGMAAVLLSACSTGLAHLVFPRLRMPVKVGMSLSGFRMHWGMAYVSIVGLALLLFTRSGEGWRGPVFFAGLDLLMVSQTLFFLQALGVVRWFGNARQWRQGPRVLAFVSAVLAQVFQFTGLVGLLDTWIDYRKRFALKRSDPGSLR